MTEILAHDDPLYQAYISGQSDQRDGHPLHGNPFPRTPRNGITEFSQWELGWCVEDAAIRENATKQGADA